MNTLPIELVLQAAPDAILLADEQGQIHWSNDACLSLLGYTAEELHGKQVEVLIPMTQRSSHREKRRAYTDNPHRRPMNTGFKTHALHKSGNRLMVDISLSHYRYQGQIWIVSVLRSIEQQIAQQRQLEQSEERLKISQQITHVGTWDWNLLTNGVIWSEETYRLFGLNPSQYKVSYPTLMRYIPAADRAAVVAAVENSIKHDALFAIEHQIQQENGQIRHVRENGVVYRDEQGNPVRMLGTIQDITEEKLVHQRLLQSEIIFTNASEGFAITNNRFVIITANPALCRMHGYEQHTIAGMGLWQLLADSSKTKPLRRAIKHIRRDGQWRGELLCARHNASPYAARVSIKEVKNADNAVMNYVVSVTDISELKTNEEQLRYLAHYDQLTQLPNRTLFLASLNQHLADAKRHREGFALLYIDLDGFKLVNDTQGHDIGDKLLCDVANRIRATSKPSQLAARLGGDEFALMITGANYKAEAISMAEQLLENLSFSRQFENYLLEISASIGITYYPSDGLNAQELMRKADQAMYQAKDDGKNAYHLFDRYQDIELQRQMQLTSDIKTAIREKQFFLHYQRKYCATSGQCTGVEALIRWNHPERGMIAPGEFIPLAEQTGLILPIGQLVLAQGIAFIGRWRQQFNQDLQVAINLSARQLHDPLLIEQIAALLEKHQVPAHCLELEVTESVIMDDAAENSKILRQLHAMGISIAVDDFGTGYSSLSYLKKLPVSCLKIDREFVTPLPSGVEDCNIVRAIISLAHTLNLIVVAEGVETEQQRQFLQQQRCDQLQGFLLARPIDGEQLIAQQLAMSTADA